MKSTYKLFGVIYDQIPESKQNHITILNNYETFDLSIERNIFDVDVYTRKVALSFMFSLETKEDLDSVLKHIRKLDKVQLVIDVNSNNNIVQSFIEKRTKQILWLLENECNNVKLITTFY